MKIVGTGLIGSKTVAILRRGGHNVFTASPNTGTLRARITQGRLTTRWSRPGQLRRRLIQEYPRAGRAAQLGAVRRRS